MRHKKYTHKQIITTTLIVLSLLSVSLIIYWRWFNFAIFSYGDWYFRFVPSLIDSTQPTIWLNSLGLGAVNEMAWRSPLDIILGLFAHFGAGLNVSEKFFIMWPLAILSTIAPYLLLVQFIKNKSVAFLGSLFYATNTYFLTINSQGHQMLVLGFNLLTLALAAFIKGLTTNKFIYLVITALLLFMAGSADFRVWYIGTLLVFALFIFFRPRFIEKTERKKFIRNIALFTLIVIGLELYSLTSLGLSMTSQAGDAILGRSLFGSQYWNLSSALALDHPFWTGQDTSWFQVNPVNIYYWIIPLIAFSSLIIFKQKDKKVLFFASLATIGILLSKQISEPIASIYPFLFENFPGFNAFREATKFYYLILLGYTVLITIVLAKLYTDKKHLDRQKTYALHALTLAVVTICIFNAMPYITGNIQKITSPRQVPADYAQLEEQLSESEKDSYFRTLWIPAQSRWGYYDMKHPRITAANLMSMGASIKGEKIDVPTQRDILDLVKSEKFPNYLSMTSVKYVIVPIRDIANQNDFFAFYGDSRTPYVDTLESLPNLKRLENYKDLAVFENEKYNAGAIAFTDIYNIDEATDFDKAYGFLSEGITPNPNFITKQPQVTSSKVADVFADLNSAEFGDKNIKKKIARNSTLYLNTDKAKYNYTIESGILNLYKTTRITQIGGENLEIKENSPEVVSTIQIDKTHSYYIESGKRLTPIDPAILARDFGYIEGSLRVVSVAKKSLLANGSFEEGPWQKNASDCDAYDNNPSITTSLNTESASKGGNSTDLWALRHTACIKSPPIAIASGGNFVLSFDYKAPYSDQIAYRITGVDLNSKPTMLRVDSQTSGWRTIRNVVTIPQGTQNVYIELYGLPPGVFSLNSRKTSFDNVFFSQANITDITPTQGGENDYEVINPPENVQNVIYTNQSNNTNLVPNGSLEKGLWQKEVGDCNDYDDNARIEMSLNSSKASQGSASLELRARSHIACTGPPSIPVQEGKTYLVSFDYLSPNLSTAHYYAQFNDSEKTAYGEDLKTKGEWQTFYRVIRAPIGADRLALKVHSPSGGSGKKQAINLYDNFKVYEVSDILGQMYSVEKNESKETPQSIEYDPISPTERNIHIKSAKDEFYLSLNDTYHPGWEVGIIGSIHPNKQISSTHFKLNGQFNAWRINTKELCSKPNLCAVNADGSYNIDLAATFKPQRIFILSTYISAFTFIACITYLTVCCVSKILTLIKSRR